MLWVKQKAVFIHLYTALSARYWFVLISVELHSYWHRKQTFCISLQMSNKFGKVNHMDKTYPLSIYCYYTQMTESIHRPGDKNILVEWDMIVFVCLYELLWKIERLQLSWMVIKLHSTLQVPSSYTVDERVLTLMTKTEVLKGYY